jgi:hypothetical protein
VATNSVAAANKRLSLFVRSDQIGNDLYRPPADFERWRLALEDDGRESAATTQRIRKLERKLARKEKPSPRLPPFSCLKKQ